MELAMVGTPLEIILQALAALEEHRGISYEGTEETALADARLMASWPADLFVDAYKRVWERFTYRRAVLASDFYAMIKGEMDLRRSQLARARQRRVRWAEQFARRQPSSGLFHKSKEERLKVLAEIQETRRQSMAGTLE